jgi:DNA mismatch endonuclease (patch repair protein)
MADVFDEEKRSWIMSRVKSRDTKPEWVVRKMLHAAGYRYRLHARDLPGKPDIVLPRHGKVIQVHGCFWHGHDCRAGRNRPAANRGYWEAKLERNIARDKRNEAALREAGWEVLVVWECEVRDRKALLEKLLGFMEA